MRRVPATDAQLLAAVKALQELSHARSVTTKEAQAASDAGCASTALETARHVARENYFGALDDLVELMDHGTVAS